MASKILIVEDDPFVQRLYKRLFEISGHVIKIVNDGNQCLASAREIKPDLILLDVMMPGLNGLEVLEKIKNDSELSHIPVVMLTVLSDTETVKRAAMLGASGFLVKSEIDPSELTKKVDALLGVR